METQRYKAVLFDLDGTLLDTLDDLADSMNAVLASIGLSEHPRDSYRYFVGDGVETLVRRTLPEEMRGDDAVVRSCVDKMRDEYGRRWRDKSKPYDGIVELLDELSARGVMISVLSNKPQEAVQDIVRHFFGKWRFHAALGARPSVPHKPDPAAALEISRLLNLTPASVLYVGDTNTDMWTAIASGMYPVGALWGFRTGEELRQSGARALISRPQELLAFF